jgi:hypothetical protein
MADFKTWKMENLVKFAFEASQEIADKEATIRHLKSDLKACMDDYRKLSQSINETKTETRFNRSPGRYDKVDPDAGVKKEV